MLKLSCNKPRCNKTYDPDLNSMMCPHEGFPKNVKCKDHNRTNCGNPKCCQSEQLQNLREINEKFNRKIG